MKLFDIDQLEKGSGWVTVFPRGKHFINKYEMVLNCDDKFFSTIEKWWKDSTFKKPYLDKGHEFNEKYGEFTEYRITEKGLEMFLVLNEEGKELVKSGKYEYLSPTFSDASDSNGKAFKNVIFTVSLVNYPALLVLDKIQNQIALSFEGENDKITKGGSGMELREIIASKMKLSLAADDGSILAKIEELINSGATIEDLKAQIEAMKAEMEKVEMACKEAKEEKGKIEAELSAIKQKAIEEEAVKVIDEAISLGQFHPSLKELKVAAFISNKDSVMKELAVIPKKSPDKQSTANSLDAVEFSAEDKDLLLSVCYDLDKPEDVKLAKEFIMSQGGK
jgi:hypothetical protein